MFIDPGIVEKHSFEVQNKETNTIHKAIYNEHVPSVLQPQCFFAQNITAKLLLGLISPPLV